MPDEQRQTTEDRATQPMEAGGWVSQQYSLNPKSPLCCRVHIIKYYDAREIESVPREMIPNYIEKCNIHTPTKTLSGPQMHKGPAAIGHKDPSN